MTRKTAIAFFGIISFFLWPEKIPANMDQVTLAFAEKEGGRLKGIFKVEKAQNPKEHQQGLMNRPSLSPDSGMLFIFPQPSKPLFWMKNTLVPLDIIFITDQNIVVHIHPQAIPHSLTPIGSQHFVRYVLELAGGSSQRIGLVEGDRLVSLSPQKIP